LPEINRLLAPVVFVIVNVPAVEAELTNNLPLVNVIVQTPAVQPVSLSGIAKLIVSLLAAEFAALTASLKLQSTPEAQVVLRSSVRVTVNVDCACALCAAPMKMKIANSTANKPPARKAPVLEIVLGAFVELDMKIYSCFLIVF